MTRCSTYNSGVISFESDLNVLVENLMFSLIRHHYLLVLSCERNIKQIFTSLIVYVDKKAIELDPYKALNKKPIFSPLSTIEKKLVTNDDMF